MEWINKLKVRWKVGSAFQVIIILLVFACTGFTVLFLKRPVLNFLVGEGPMPIWISVVYYLLILPIYNVFLLFYGLIFGQFQFFWSFEKRFFQRLLSIFKKTNQ
ncbi:MAG: prolipoprotein diacylglyceryl transferase [Cyclobacteriaceae bacterium]